MFILTSPMKNKAIKYCAAILPYELFNSEEEVLKEFGKNTLVIRREVEID